ncbi:MAG: sodium:solute symporter family protein, partial [Candidatus Aminicenantales bacterium]
PFLCLFLISWVTKPVPRMHLDRFFATLHTPVQKTEEEDKRAVAESQRNPLRYEKRKIRPGSSWEVMKPGKVDILGFGGSWLLVGTIILLLWVMVSIR